MYFQNIGKYSAIHIFCCKHIELVYGVSQTCSLFATKHVMRYLKGTLDCGLRYAVGGEIRLHGYTDLDWVGSIDGKKEYLGILF